MTGLVRKATLLCVGGVLLAGVAMAGVPSPANSTISCVTLADGANTIDPNVFVIRDPNNNPVVGSSVVLDFSACASPGQPAGNVKVGATQADDPAVTVACTGKTFTKNADGTGTVRFSLIGGTNVAFGLTARPTCCKVYADGTFMGTVAVSVASYDLAGGGSVDPGDLSAWLDYFGGAHGAYRTYADYNCDGAVDPSDLSIWLDAFGLSPTIYTGTYCLPL